MQKKAERTLRELLQAMSETYSADEAAASLGISRRSMFYQLSTVSPEVLKRELINHLRWNARRVTSLQRQLDKLREDYNVAEQYNQTLAAENRVLKNMGALFNKVGAMFNSGVSGAVSDNDPYAVLGVRPDAPAEVIEAAHKALAKKCHPDRGGSTEMMQRVNRARDQIAGKNGRR